MKNLRKVLAMVLVVATLLSFATVASAASYKDDTKISGDYQMAVDVLSTIGILNGYEDGTFRPANNITRAEMAKMIAVLANKGTDVSKLYATANTFADMKDNWAVSYVAYCAQTGIVAGRNATTFDPNANVTGLETAKMLLVVLGLDAEKQGYVGANWKVNVLRDAKEFGLLGGFAAGYDITKAISREEAAQMMFNALGAQIVIGYVSNNILTVTNKVCYGPDFTLTDANATGATLLYNNVLVSNKLLAQIYTGLQAVPTVDCFGRPAVKYTYTVNNLTKTIGVYPYAPAFTYTSYDNIYGDLKSYIKTAGYTFTNCYVDGQPAALSVDANGNSNVPSGNGVHTEVYVNHATKTISVIVINTYIDQVAKVNSYSGTMTLKNTNGTFTNTVGAKGGEYVLFTKCNGSCGADKITGTPYCAHAFEIAKGTTVTVKNAYVATSASVEHFFVADGKEYNYAANKDVVAVGDYPGVLTRNELDKKVVVYVDDCGYVMLINKPSKNVETYVAYFVEDAWTYNRDTIWQGTPGGGAIGNGTQTNDAIYFDGTTKEDVRVDSDLFWELVDATMSNEGLGRVVEYKLNGAGEAVEVQLAKFAAEGVKLSKSIDRLEGNILNENTQFMIRTYNFATGKYEYKTFTGYTKLDNTYVCNYQVDTNYDGTPDAFTNIQYLTDNTTSAHVTHVFIDAAYAGQTNRFLTLEKLWLGADALIANADTKSAAGLENFYVYDAIVNGKNALVAVDNGGLNEMYNGAAAKTCMYTSTLVAISNVTTYHNLPLYIAVTGPVTESGVTADTFKIVGGRLEIYNGSTLVKYTPVGATAQTDSVYLADNFKVTDIVVKNGAVKDVVTGTEIKTYADGEVTFWVFVSGGKATELVRIVNG